MLLDKDWKAVVGDFGFALEIPKTESGRTLITAPLVARTEGYKSYQAKYRLSVTFTVVVL